MRASSSALRDVAALIGHGRAQLSRLFACQNRVGRLGSTACLHLLDLHAIPLFHLLALVVVDGLVLAADLADCVSQFGLEELA
jgi:hypothetical protein